MNAEVYSADQMHELLLIYNHLEEYSLGFEKKPNNPLGLFLYL